MLLTTRQVGEALGIPREVAAKLMPRLPGARHEAVRPGAIPGWVADDADLNSLAPAKLQELIDEARAEVQTSAFVGAGTRATAPTGPAASRSPLAADLADEEAAIRREELELRRLRIQAEKRRLEEQEAQRRPAGPGDMMTNMLLLEQIRELKQQLADVHKKSELGALAQVLAPVAPKLVELFAGRPAFGVAELLKLLSENRPDPLKIIEQLKTLGVLDSGGSLDQVEKLGRVVDVVRKVAGQFGEGPAESPWVEIFRALSPEVGRVVDKVTGVWQESLNLRRRELELRRAGTASSPAAAVARLSEELAREAARLNDGFFPRLVEKLSPMFESRGREFLAAIQRGDVAEAEAFETLQGVGFPLTPQIRGYLRRFMNWLRAATRPQPAATSAPRSSDGSPAPSSPPSTATAPGEIKARCSQCPQEYGYPDERTWQNDNHRCDAVLEDGRRCGGLITRITE